jgi:hypothetical protein
MKFASKFQNPYENSYIRWNDRKPDCPILAGFLLVDDSSSIKLLTLYSNLLFSFRVWDLGKF